MLHSTCLEEDWHGAALTDLLCRHLCFEVLQMQAFCTSSAMTKQFPPPTLALPLSHQHVHTLIWIMFLLQVPPVINGVPFRTMAKSGLYWLTLIIDSQRLLPWFMIVCYFYISCQIHLVSPQPGSASANSKHPAPFLLTPPFPTLAQGNGLCFLLSTAPCSR